MSRIIPSIAVLLSSLLFSCGERDFSTGGNHSTSRFDGTWLLLKRERTWVLNGVAGVDSVVLDTGDIYAREFTLVEGEAIFWIRYNPGGPNSEVSSFKGLNDSMRVIGGEDTVLCRIQPGRLVISGQERDGFMDSLGNPVSAQVTLTFASYADTFPPPIWDRDLSDDAFEPDNAWSAAKLFVADAPGQAHTLTEGDEDWVRFSAEPGITYWLFTTGNLDMYLELFDSDGVSLIASDDDGGPSLNSMIVWTCPQSGIYYLKSRGFSATQAGPYQLRATTVDPGLGDPPGGGTDTISVSAPGR